MTSPSDRLDFIAFAAMTGRCAPWGLNQVTVEGADAGISPVAQAGLRSRAAAFAGIAFAEALRLPSFSD